MTSGTPPGGPRWGDAPRPAAPGYGAPAPGWGPPPGRPGPPGWGPPPVPAPPRRRRRTGRVLLAVGGGTLVVALLLVLALGLVVGPRFLRYDVLDAGAVAEGVTRVVTEDWRRTVSDVRCPSDQRTRPGVMFRCTAVVDGRPQEVPVVVVDEAGTYEVGQPR